VNFFFGLIASKEKVGEQLQFTPFRRLLYAVGGGVMKAKDGAFHKKIVT